MSGFYGNARQTFGQDGGFIGGVLAVEDVGGGHGHDAHGDVLRGEGFLRFQGQLDFGAGGNDDGLGIALGFADDVAAAFDVVQLLFVARLEFQVLTAENQAGRVVFGFYGFCPRYQGFGGVARAPYVHIRNQAQGSGLLDRLVGRTVFAKADGVVGEDEDGVDFHQCRHAQGVAFVFAEHQESRAEGFHAAVQGKAVHDGTHAELAHAVVDVVAAFVAGNGDAV